MKHDQHFVPQPTNEGKEGDEKCETHSPELNAKGSVSSPAAKVTNAAQYTCPQCGAKDGLHLSHTQPTPPMDEEVKTLIRYFTTNWQLFSNGYGDFDDEKLARWHLETVAKLKVENDRLKQERGGIETYLDKEFFGKEPHGTRTGDLLDDFECWIQHHAKLETERYSLAQKVERYEKALIALSQCSWHRAAETAQQALNPQPTKKN